MPLLTPNDESDGDESRTREAMPFWVFVLFEAALAPLALALAWVLKQPPLAGFAWEADAALWGLAASVPTVALMAVAVRWPVGPLAGIKRFLRRELSPVLRGCEWPDLAVVSAAAGVGEEMLFRGVIQGALTRALGPWVGVAGSSLLFGALHPVSPTYVVIAGSLGAYFGLVWVASGNLLTVIVAHSAYDFVALLLLVGEWNASVESDP